MPDARQPLQTILTIAALLGFLIAVGVATDTRRQPQSDTPGNGKDAVRGSVEVRMAGADATNPAQIPPKGWWHVVKRAGAGFSSDRVMANAAAVTFYALLALFPALASLISIYGLFADPSHVKDLLESMAGIIPGGGMDIINGQVAALTAKSNQALGFGAILGLLTSLWSANAGVKAIFDALNVVYHETEKRSFIWLSVVSLSFTMAVIAFIIIALFAVVVIPVALNFFGLANTTSLLIRIARWPIMFVVVSTALAFMYRFGPSRRQARWQWVSWGSASAALAWILVSLAFSFYVANFGSYNKTYGSLGAVIGFMTWIWISSIVVLMGAEINAELEQQTGRDSTIGPEKPAGTRGAYKADVKT